MVCYATHTHSVISHNRGRLWSVSMPLSTHWTTSKLRSISNNFKIYPKNYESATQTHETTRKKTILCSYGIKCMYNLNIAFGNSLKEDAVQSWYDRIILENLVFRNLLKEIKVSEVGMLKLNLLEKISRILQLNIFQYVQICLNKQM